jgi:hypothetical protein
VKDLNMFVPKKPRCLSGDLEKVLPAFGDDLNFNAATTGFLSHPAVVEQDDRKLVLFSAGQEPQQGAQLCFSPGPAIPRRYMTHPDLSNTAAVAFAWARAGLILGSGD